MRKLAVVGLALLLAGCGKEAGYHGKTVSAWCLDLRRPEAGGRREAAAALGAMGPSAKAAVPDLAAALKDADDGVRIQAARALWSMGREAGPAVPELIAALHDANAEVRLNAAGALGPSGQRQDRQSPRLPTP